MSPKPFLLVAIAALLSQCEKPSPASSSDSSARPLATVGDAAITADDLKAEADRRIANREVIPSSDELLQEMVERLVMVESAKKRGLDQEQSTRRRIEGLLISQLRETELEPKLKSIVVTDEQVRAAYEERLAEYSRPAMDRFAILFQAADMKASESRREEAKSRVQAGLKQTDEAPARGGRGPAAGGFGAAAIQFSDDQVSRYRGGDIGWLKADAELPRIPAEVLAAGRALEKGARSTVIETETGFYAIMKTDSRPGGSRPFEEVAPRLRQSLLQEEQREMKKNFVAESMTRFPIHIDSAAVREIELPKQTRLSKNADSPPAFPAASR